MKVCFWGNVAGALNGSTDGGGELQIALLAKALARAGHDVVVIDYDTNEGFITEDGIKVIKIDGWEKGIRIVRTFTHRLPKLYRKLKDQKADIYYCRMCDFRHALVYWAARKVRAKFVLGMASDLDVMNFAMRWKYYHISHINGLWAISNLILLDLVHSRLLRKADLVLVQHEGQKQMLLQKKIASVIFPNLIDLDQIQVVSKGIHKDFIYVGELNKRKGFDEFFDLVKNAPLHSFKVIGQPVGKAGNIYYDKLKAYKNVSLFGRLSHSDTVNQIANSVAMISTSPMEGFPNVFLEAWAYGIPVLSLYVDPDGVIRREKLGVITYGNHDKLLETLDTNLNTEEFALRAKAYVERNHLLNDTKIEQVSSIFTEICNM